MKSRTGGLRNEGGANVEAANYSLVLRAFRQVVPRRSGTCGTAKI